jgi:hypothetical protein
MAEEVIIKFDIGVATNNIARLESELKKVKQEYKAAEIGSKEFYKTQEAGKQLTEQIKKQNDALKANTNALNGINSSAKFGEKSYGALKQSIKSTKEELLKLDVGSDKFIETQKELVALEKKRIDVEKQIPSLFQERVKGAIDEANTLKGLREEIKRYTAAVIAGEAGAAEKLAELKDKLNDVKDATSTFAGSGVEKLNASMGLLTESITNFDGDKFKTALKGIGTAMKAIPIFLILEGIKLLVENFEKVFTFFQSFTDEAKAVKAATKSFEELTIAINRESAAVSAGLIVQEAELGLMQAQGASNEEILAQEKRIFDSKKQLLFLKAQELKAQAALAITKQAEIQANDSIGESVDRAAANLARKLGQDKIADFKEKEIAESKKKRNEENAKQIEESFNAAKTLTAELTALELNNQAKLTTNYKEQTQKKIDSSRELRQAQIDNIQDVYQRQLAQIQFDEDNALEDLKRNKDFLAKKAQLEKEILEKARQENIIAEREQTIRLQQIANEAAQAKIDLIKNDYEKQREQIELNEKIALENAVNTIINNEALLFETKKQITAKYAEEERKLALDYVTKDLEAEAQYNVLKATSYDEQFQARQEQLALQKQTELENFNLTENQRLLIIAEYNKKELDLEREKVEQKRQLRQAEIDITSSAFTALNNLAILFTNDQKELEKLSKIGALISIGTNTATAISNLLAVSFSPLDPANAATGGLAAYAKIAAGIATITANALQAKALVNSFEEGGYTGDGPSNEVSTNLGSKPYTYHKSEYVIPARVLGTPQGNMLAAQAESMRLGMSNPMPYIGGMFDGGFTARSAGADANNSISNNAALQQLLNNLPAPIVKVTDINKVQNESIKVIQTSSL